LLVFLLIVAMIAWGGSWPSGKMAAATASPEVLTFWRFLLTVITFLPILIFQRLSLRLNRRALLYTFLGGACIVSYNANFFRGLQTGLAGAGGVLVTTLNPILTTFFAAIAFRRPLYARQMIGLILGLIGGLFLLEIWAISPQHLMQTGNAFFVLACASWAVLTIISEKSRQSVSLPIFSFYVYGFATLLDFFLTTPMEIMAAFQATSGFWLNTIYLAVFATTFATTVYFHASSRLGSGRASSFIFTVPVSAVFISWLLLNEIPKITTLIGGAIGIVAVYLMNATPARPKLVPKPSSGPIA
jgi:drug/metabolite transporter (DMT)-like permease